MLHGRHVLVEARLLKLGVVVANVPKIELHAAMGAAGKQAAGERTPGEHCNVIGRAPGQNFGVNLSFENVIGQLV